MKHIANKKTILLMVSMLIIGVGIGYFVKSRGETNSEKRLSTENIKSEKKAATRWTCSMHPQIDLPSPGKCPICGMTLIPKKNADSSAGAVQIKLSPSAVKLAEIETFPVEQKFINYTVRMTGKIELNEQNLAYITARIPGRIDKLFVDYTGISVRKGDHMAEYFSPELLIAQRELLLAVKGIKEQKKDSFRGYGMSPEETLASVKKKLLYWGLTDENIKQIIKNGKVVQHITLYAPVNGIVIEKNAVEGKYFKVGDKLFTIADLSNVWVILEAYESDLSKLKYGQKVEFETEAYPGKTFTGRIAFIEPVMEKKSRIIRVRVDVENKQGLLKPGLFVRAKVKSKIATDNKVLLDKSLAGKWICPMHPGVIEDKPGNCHICNMPLVKSETLGDIASDANMIKAPIVIPDTAPLITGKRAVVYIQKSPGLFEGREVVLGLHGDEYYIVKKGLKPGELVVTNGNFKIDSALQIMAKPSMMTNSKGKPASTAAKGKLSVPEKFINALDMIYSNYFKIQKALRNDDLSAAKKSAAQLKAMLAHIPMKILDKKAMKEWHQIEKELQTISAQAIEAEKINDFRKAFENLSSNIDNLKEKFGTSNKFKIQKFFCPMAFNNKGAYWLQNNDDKINNPYFGKAMPGCGEKVEAKNE